MNKLLNVKGFSLVETIIGLGVTAVAGLAILNLQSQGLKANKDIETGGIANDFAHEIRVLLARGKTCTVNFSLPGNVTSDAGELKFDSSNADASLTITKLIYDNDVQTVKAYVGQTLRNDIKATLTGMFIKNIIPMTTDNDSFKGELQLAYTKGDSGIGGKNKIIKMPIYLKTEVASGSVVKITGCATAASESTNPILHCGALGKIYLPTGFNGSVADTDGCVSPVAFVGPQGPAGAPGGGGGSSNNGQPGVAGGNGNNSGGSGNLPPAGTVIGGGSCVPYHQGPCTGHCGGGNTGCPSTWNYHGVGQSGGCSRGTKQDGGAVQAGITAFLCIQD